MYMALCMILREQNIPYLWNLEFSQEIDPPRQKKANE